MILPVHERLRAHLARLLTALYSLDSAEPSLALEYPPNRDLGDLGTPVAFELARRLRKAPRAIAQEIAGAFGTLEGVGSVAAAPNGYLNFFLDAPGVPARPALADRTPGRRGGSSDTAPGRGGLRPAAARPSSSTRRSIRTRRRTSATCGTPRSATRSCACCASAASRSRCRTTSTTPASRWPTSSSGSASRRQDARRDSRDRRHHAVRLLLLGSLRARDRVVRRGQGAAEDRAPRRCTTSSTAATRTPRSPPSSPTASSAAT